MKCWRRNLSRLLLICFGSIINLRSSSLYSYHIWSICGLFLVLVVISLGHIFNCKEIQREPKNNKQNLKLWGSSCTFRLLLLLFNWSVLYWWNWNNCMMILEDISKIHGTALILAHCLATLYSWVWQLFPSSMKPITLRFTPSLVSVLWLVSSCSSKCSTGWDCSHH